MIIQQIFDGITLGMVYALIAVGYSLVFGVLRLVNFSHGSTYAFGAHIAMVVVVSLGMGLIWGILASIIATGILTMSIDRLTLKPLRVKKSKGISALITTIGVSYIVQNGLMIVFGSRSKPFPKVFDYGNFYVGGVLIKSTQLGIVVVSIILLLILTYIVQRTKIGLAMRAIQQNPRAANLMGIEVDRVIQFTFFLGGASAAVAGTLISGYYQIVNPQMGFLAGLKAFSAAVLGGIGVLHGSVFGGLLVGLAESMTAFYVGGGYRDAVAFIVLVAVLIFRPHGLFGKKKVEKV
jgi:branched-chain amino acid transport system permease protein